MGQMPCHVAPDDDSDWGPVTDKFSGDGAFESRRFMWGFSSMQGWRHSMEDAHLTIPSLGQMARASGDARAVASASGWDETAVFGVLDGHGGPQVARFCERHLPVAIARCPGDNITGALTTAFANMDELLSERKCLDELRKLSDPSNGVLPLWRCSPMTIGSTVIVCCLRPDSIVVANAGDCRAVLSRDARAVDLSTDHKPESPAEMQRIKQAGGWVEAEDHGDMPPVYRMNGDLSLSRSVGDLEYKQNAKLPPCDQLISAVPDIQTFRREVTDEFIVIGCDGVWDVITSQQAVDFVRPRLGPQTTWAQRLKSSDLELSSILEELLDHCISPDLDETDGLGGDNMTAILVLFVPGGKLPTQTTSATKISAGGGAVRMALPPGAPGGQQIITQHMQASQSHQHLLVSQQHPANPLLARMVSGPGQASGQQQVVAGHQPIYYRQ